MWPRSVPLGTGAGPPARHPGSRPGFFSASWPLRSGLGTVSPGVGWGWRLRGEGRTLVGGGPEGLPGATQSEQQASGAPGRLVGGPAGLATREVFFFFLKDAEAQLVYLRNGCLK